MKISESNTKSTLSSSNPDIQNDKGEYEVIIVGGGSAGMAAAISAYKNGSRNILILERDQELGGILLQCIHNGFGLQIFKEELSGPAYASRWIAELESLSIDYKVNSMVIHISDQKVVEYVNPQKGYVQVKGQAVILAMGCRERTRGAIDIPGYRPSGIWAAGTAQRYINIDGYLVGKKIFILGSGDIGLIMARRMTLEGADVLGVAELMPYSNGLPRNIKQCLEDFNIPLFLSHTITDIKGKDRVTSIVINQVDDKFRPIKGTSKEFKVDTLLLSVGLIPENSLSEEAGVELYSRTKGAIVDESFQTNVEGIFACGNVLHVHDLVDFVSNEGTKAGLAASRYVQGKLCIAEPFMVEAGAGIGYVLPQKVNIENIDKQIEFMFRVTDNYKKVVINIYQDDTLIKQVRKAYLIPAEMEKVILKKEELINVKTSLRFEIISP